MTRKSKLVWGALLTSFLISPLLARAVTVGPARLEYSLDPGTSVSGAIMLRNDGQTTATFYPSFEKFTEQNGQKVFLKEESDLATWINTAKSVTLQPGEEKQVPFTINVPQNAPPGGHFAVIWWSTTPPGPAGTQVSIVTRAGILVYLKVSGDIHEAAEATLTSSRLIFALPADFTFNIADTGNNYVKPQGTFYLKNIFGGVRFAAPFNEFGSNILPGDSKSFDLTLPAGFYFGLYRAELDLTYGGSGQKLDPSFWVLILPVWNIVWFALILLIAFLGVPWGLRKYNRWIIAKAGGARPPPRKSPKSRQEARPPRTGRNQPRE